MSAMHLYAIIPTRDKVIFDVTGVDGQDNVRTISYGGVAAVASASPSVDYRSMEREQAIQCLVAHQRVIEAVMQSFPALPVKFGTTLSDETEVRRLLAQGESLFGATLEKFTGLEQMEVVALWNLSAVLQEISREESIVQAKAVVSSRAATATITDTDRIAIGQMVHASVERQRAELRDRVLLPSLRDAALDVIVNPVMDDNMVANLAFLVDETGRITLERRLNVLSEEFEGRLDFRCVSPLPPYSFATVDVESPSFEAVDEARRKLGLGETATSKEIKQAYYQMARELHPDHNLDDPESADRMSKLASAYNLLTTYAGSPTPDGETTQQAACCFDRETVEGTLLIAIRRQESLADWR